MHINLRWNRVWSVKTNLDIIESSKTYFQRKIFLCCTWWTPTKRAIRSIIMTRTANFSVEDSNFLNNFSLNPFGRKYTRNTWSFGGAGGWRIWSGYIQLCILPCGSLIRYNAEKVVDFASLFFFFYTTREKQYTLASILCTKYSIKYPHLFWSKLSSIWLRLSLFFCVRDWQAKVVSLLDHHP